MWERFFNWQSDLDWAWGPLLPLRPPRDTPIRPWVWMRLFLVFTVLGLMLVALLALGGVLLPRLAAAEHYTPPLPLPETLSTLRAMATDPGTRLVLIGIALCLPPLFFLACLPFHCAWNRRAARLRVKGEKPGREEKTREEGVWPPPPAL